jgi:hypothetical protein
LPTGARSTIGIDLAAQDKKTALCVIHWARGKARVRPPAVGPAHGVDEERLASALSSDAWVGVDAPFGWPEPFVHAIGGYANREPWPQSFEHPDALRFRLTDRLVRDQVKLPPLSVSSDRIGVTAWRCARLLTLARADRKPVDRSGSEGVVEVYPGAALTCWGLVRRGYKASGGAPKKKTQRAARQRLVKAIERRAPWIEWEEDARKRCVESDDALDSFLSALVARAAAVGLTRRPETRAELRAARVQGWIHLPKEDSLPKLATARRRT